MKAAPKAAAVFSSTSKKKNPLYIFTSIVIILLLAAVTGSAAIWGALLLVILVLFYPFFFYLWDKIYRVEDIADQVFHARTDDGWNIAMHFHRPRYPRPGAYPVILAHGIAMNKYGVDLDRGHSLAYYLKQNGFPVFVLGLRGTGKTYHSSPGRYRDFNFDEMVENDFYGVIRKVKELTGAPRVNIVGHSLGAMLAYGFLGREMPGHEAVASLCSIAGPGKVDHARTSIWSVMARYPWLNQALDFKFGSQLVTPITARFATPIEDLLYNRDVVSGVTIRKLMKNGIENIAAGVANQFFDWIKSGQHFTIDGSFDYRRGLENIRVPTLFIAGARDHLAPVESVRFAYDCIKSRKKSLRIMGREEGLPVDYCHTGLVIGDRAIVDVFPIVLDWLNRYGCKMRGNFFRRFIKKFRKPRARRVDKPRRHREEFGGSDVIST